MKLPTAVYRYIEFELYHYEQYKKELELERERIIESSPERPDGQPKGNNLSNEPLDKVVRLHSSAAILSLERSISAVEKSLKQLTETHIKIFENYYGKGRKDIYRMCDEFGISHETFKRYRQTIILAVARELGLLKIS